MTSQLIEDLKRTPEEARVNLAEAVSQHLKIGSLSEGYLDVCQALGGNLNACISLIERLLPGWGWQFGTCCVSDDALLFPDLNCPIHGERLKQELGEFKAGDWQDVGFDIDLRPSGQPAVAMLIAIIEAVAVAPHTGKGGG